MRAAEALRVLQETPEPPTCSCEKCAGMCARPCRGTPDEALRIINAGLAHRLAIRPAYGDDDWEVVGPASRGAETTKHNWPTADCTFFRDGLCELHAAGLKPAEGRLAHHEIWTGNDPHDLVNRTWKSKLGRQVVERWKRLVGYKEA